MMSKDRTSNDRIERSLLENFHYGMKLESHVKFQHQGSWYRGGILVKWSNERKIKPGGEG